MKKMLVSRCDDVYIVHHSMKNSHGRNFSEVAWSDRVVIEV